MNKSEFLQAVEKAINKDDFTAVTIIADDHSVSLVGNMDWEKFEDLILELAEDIAERVRKFERIH